MLEPARSTLTSGLGLDDLSGLARRGSSIDFRLTLAHSRISQSTRLCLSQWLIWFLYFRFDAVTVLGAFLRTDFFFYVFCIKSSLGTQGGVGKL